MRVHVEKWYLDLVTPDGSAWIGYAADVRVRRPVPLRFAYGGTLEGGSAGTARASHRVGLRARLPGAADDSVEWVHPGLRVHGRWDARRTSAARTLGDAAPADGAPTIEWHALATAADAAVRVGDRVVEGRGYVERTILRGTLNLGIDVLHWGRWIADDGGPSLVWIRWIGPRPLTVVLLDGAEADAAEVDERGVRGPFGALELDAGAELRAGALGATLLERLPLTVRVAARRLRGWDETKWVARGSLRTADGSERSGRAIHEVVRFGGER
ncbi:MAG: hypothetical protein AAFU73_02275 [Planctomycetota bacterium]